MTIAEQAKQHYAEHLQHDLEATQAGRYVAIEPRSGSHYLADTFVEAAMAARVEHPSDQPFVILIGSDTAFHLGASGL